VKVIMISYFQKELSVILNASIHTGVVTDSNTLFKHCVHARCAVSKYNSRLVNNSANDCYCRFWTEMATKKKNCGLLL